MRWPEEHKKQRNKKTKKTKKKNKKTKNTKITKNSFSVISQIFLLFFGGCPKIPFLTTWSKNTHPKNTIKMGVAARHFSKNRYASPNGDFWTNKSQIQKFQLSFFCLFLLFQQQKTPKLTETPIFIVF